MSKQTISIGTSANDGTGDSLRAAMSKANDNFDELYASVQVVSITDPAYGASTAASEADNAAAINLAIAAAVAVGGVLWVPPGNFAVAADTILHDTADVSLSIVGAGPTASQWTTTGSGVLLDVATPNSNSSYFSLRQIGINGPGGTSPAGTGVRLGNVVNHGTIEDVHFNGLNTCLKLEDVYHVSFRNLRFRNYITGVIGTSGTAANNNTFENCYFGDGKAVTPAVAVPVNSAYMGYNVYFNCNFESRGYIKQIDMRNGSGFDTFEGCRFEQLNNGEADWLILGNNQQLLNCTIWASASYNNVGSAYYLVKIGETSHGKGNLIRDLTINTAYAANTLLLSSGARHNYVKFIALLPTDTVGAVYNVVTDVSQGGNTVEYPGGGCTKETSSGIGDSWGGGPFNQLICDTFTWSTFTWDGLTNSSGPAGLTAQAIGPLGYGNVRDLNTPTGNKRGHFSFSATADYTYIFSFWALPKTANDTLDLAIGTSLGSPTWRNIILADTAKWQRVFIAYRATATGTIYVQLRANGASGLYVANPQFEEWDSSTGRFGPAGFVHAATATGGQNYAAAQNPRPFDKRNMIGLAAPTVGRHTQGDIMWNAAAVVGAPPGWVCAVSGASGTWGAMANLV